MNISVVIPAYNAAESIGKAIESCHSQSFPPFEIIVVSDGCTDTTETIIQTNYPEIKLIRLSENKGVAYARNQGLKKASGEWVAFLDADDEWHPQKLEITATHLKNIPDASGLIHSFSTDAFVPIASSGVMPIQSVSFWNLLLRNKAQGSSICLKKNEKFYFNEKFRYCEDHELAVRMAWEKQLFFLPILLTKLGREQLSEGGLSGNKWAMRKGEIKMYSQIGKRNPALVFLIPFLILFSLLKHYRK